MDGIYTILSVVFLVFGILQIILFFNLWGMTNDIRKLTAKYVPRKKMELMREILKKNSSSADILFDALYNELYEAFGSGTPSQPIIKVYKALYSKAGVEFPSEFENMKNFSDLLKLEDHE